MLSSSRNCCRIVLRQQHAANRVRICSTCWGAHAPPRLCFSRLLFLSTTTTTTTTTPLDTGINDKNKNSSKNNNNNNTHLDVKTRILRSSLLQVKEYGWTSEAIVAAVQLEYPHASPSLAGMITPHDMVTFAMDDWNERLRQELETEKLQWLQQPSNRNRNTTKETSPPPLPAATVVDRVVFALQRRLEFQIDLMQCRRWSEGMALGVSTPNRALQTTKQLKTLIQTVVANTMLLLEDENNNNSSNNNNNDSGNNNKQIGELSQLALGAVYIATEFHMLADSSPNYQHTWDFLRQRVQDWHDGVQQRLHGISSLSSFFGSGDNHDGQRKQQQRQEIEVISSIATAFASGMFSLIQVKNPLPNDISYYRTTANRLLTSLASNLVRPSTTTVHSSSSMDGTRPSHYQEQNYTNPPQPLQTAGTTTTTTRKS